jgi:hypothetical protein
MKLLIELFYKKQLYRWSWAVPNGPYMYSTAKVGVHLAAELVFTQFIFVDVI